MRSRRAFLASGFFLLGVIGAGSGCSHAGSTRAADDDVTSVESTPVKSQAIANCWLYATAGWAESLHKGATGADIDLSEAYWSYWYWYEEITGGDLTLAVGEDYRRIDPMGWWGLGADLIERYGWMAEADFLPESDAKAQRHTEALDAISLALVGGALAEPAARRDPKKVRAALDRAWGIAPKVVAELERAFPIVAPAPPADTASLPDKPATLISVTERAAGGAMSEGLVRAPQSLPVLGSDGASRVTLADVVGHRAEGTKAADGARTGAEAWSELRYDWTDEETARRSALLKNVQSVLNRRLAIPVAWVIGSATDGAYHAQPTPLTGQAPNNAFHESILVDYEVDDVPGFGTLRVDVRETRPAALEATLADAAHVRFFRIKNSWGVDPVWTEEEMRQNGYRPPADGAPATKPGFLPSKAGFNDLFVDYLDLPHERARGTHYMQRIALPPKLRFAIPPR